MGRAGYIKKKKSIFKKKGKKANEHKDDGNENIEAKAKKPHRPGTKDSKNSTLLICDYGQNVQEQVNAFAERQAQRKIDFTPIMAVSLDQAKKPVKFYVFCNDIFWQVDSFKKCLDIYIKTFFVLDVAYPKEGVKCCEFVAAFFFNFPTTDGKINTFIRDVKTLEQKQGIVNKLFRINFYLNYFFQVPKFVHLKSFLKAYDLVFIPTK